jgi:peptidyl-prolyl isomerase D
VQEAEIIARRAAEQAADGARHGALRADTSRPLVYLDVEIAGEPIGRMEFALFTAEAPRAAENFRALCTCEKGSVPDEPGREGAGKPYCLRVRT